MYVSEPAPSPSFVYTLQPYDYYCTTTSTCGQGGGWVVGECIELRVFRIAICPLVIGFRGLFCLALLLRTSSFSWNLGFVSLCSTSVHMPGTPP